MTAPTPASQRAERPLAGVALVALATLTFALNDVLIKHLAMHYPVVLIGLVRSISGLILLAAIFGPTMGARLWKTQRTWAVFGRGLILALATLTLGLALRALPVGETISILYLSPFLVMILAVPLLGERVSLLGWVGAAIGFSGVLLIIRPGGGLDAWGVSMALVNVALAAAYTLVTRALTRTESTQAMMFHVTLAGVFLFAVLMPFSLEGPVSGVPPIVDLGMMALVGGVATLGHFLLTAAYREAPASLLAPVTYLHLVWAGGMGFVVFSHIPDGLSIVGMVLVAASGAGVALRAHFTNERLRIPQPPETIPGTNGR